MALAAVLPAGTAAAAPSRVPDWAAPQIRVVASRGLMGTKNPRRFRQNAPLTGQALANLVFGLSLDLTPPVTVPPAPPPVPSPDQLPSAPTPDGLPRLPTADSTATDPTATDPTTTDPTTTDPAATVPTTTDPTATVPTATEPTATTATPTDTTPTEAIPAKPPPAPPAGPPRVAHPAAPVTMAALDARLVSSLGLSGAASEFAKRAGAAGLRVPWRFGTEVVARLLGLRINHPAAQDGLELLPSDDATRAEAAYSAARILGFGWLGNSWETAAVQSLADSFALPHYSRWQRRILTVAVSKIGMPYIWGGTSDGPEAPFGVRSRGGYDCSGFVWRVYKLQRYPGERSLASTLRGRTTFQMSVEVPASERIPFAKLQPADVIFFGDRGPRSTSAEVDHMAIYLGKGWFIQSS
ncbi:MAG TPA: NlpC/P60 family protein, partial [Gaiellaceae bacterium]|nr:NlpC/P60 family protein [Gaiellaceae bacterium]